MFDGERDEDGASPVPRYPGPLRHEKVLPDRGPWAAPGRSGQENVLMAGVSTGVGWIVRRA